MNAIEKIVKANYVADAQDVEQLAANVQTGREADGTYLRVLVATCQGLLGTIRRGRANAQSQGAVLEKVHEEFYPAVLRGVSVGQEIDDIERKRRANFARSAASTLRAYVTAGGDMRGLTLAEVTKGRLRRAIQPSEQVPEGTSRAEAAFIRASTTIVRTAQKLAGKFGENARDRIEEAIIQLEAILETLPPPATADPGRPDIGSTTIIPSRSARRTIVGQPMLHRGG